MSNENTTAHDGIAKDTGEELEESELTPEEFINSDEVSSIYLEKIKVKVIAAMVKERVDAGMSEEDAEEEARNIIDIVLKEKREEEKYILGEFDTDFFRLYLDEPFLGAVSLSATKKPDVNVPTAYVGFQPNGKTYEVIMGFNPKFFRSLSPIQRSGVIRHEMYHLVFQHIFARAIASKEYQTLYNWATDMAINSIIGKENLPSMVIMPGVHPINSKTGEKVPGPFAEYVFNAPPLQSSDYYFEELRKIQQKHGKSETEVALNAGMGTMDDHSNWGKLPKDVQDAIRDKVRGALNEAAKNAERQHNWGSVPEEIQGVIRRMLSSEVNWRSVLRGFMGRCRSIDRLSTIKRINKKAPYLLPGSKRKYVAKFGVFIDQSGSMADSDIALLFGELEGAAQFTDLDVYHFDTEIDEKSHTVWSKSKPFPKPHRTRSGGTSFQAVADFCNRPEYRNRWSGIIILTDGYAPTMGTIVGAKVLWVVTETGTMEHIRRGDLAIQMKKDQEFKRY